MRWNQSNAWKPGGLRRRSDVDGGYSPETREREKKREDKRGRRKEEENDVGKEQGRESEETKKTHWGK